MPVGHFAASACWRFFTRAPPATHPLQPLPAKLPPFAPRKYIVVVAPPCAADTRSSGPAPASARRADIPSLPAAADAPATACRPQRVYCRTVHRVKRYSAHSILNAFPRPLSPSRQRADGSHRVCAGSSSSDGPNTCRTSSRASFTSSFVASMLLQRLAIPRVRLHRTLILMQQSDGVDQSSKTSCGRAASVVIGEVWIVLHVVVDHFDRTQEPLRVTVQLARVLSAAAVPTSPRWSALRAAFMNGARLLLVLVHRRRDGTIHQFLVHLLRGGW